MSDHDYEVRASRLGLARALARPGASAAELDEAERLLLGTLNGGSNQQTGPEEDWEVLSELAAVARLRGRARREVDLLIRAVSAAPPEAAASLANRVMGLLEADSADMSLVEGLSPDVARELWKAAHDPGQPDEVVQLAARFALFRGDIAAASEVSRQRQSVGTQAEDLHAANLAASILQRLADDDLAGAEAQLTTMAHVADDAAFALAEALLLYARGDYRAARLRAEASGGTGDLGAVAVIALLAQAALTDHESDLLYAEARTAASGAARRKPSSAEPLLLRAQVLLEAGLDLDVGRGLLQTAVSRRQEPERLSWWAIQERSRRDDRYTYFRVELAAAQGDRAQVVDRAQSYSALRTQYAQDARLRELWAEAVDDQAESARLLRDAANDHRQASNLASAVRCLRGAYEKQQDSTNGLELADALWASSFAVDGNADPVACVNEGLNLMGSLEGRHPEASLARTTLLWGLLLVRRDALTPAEPPLRPDQRWRPLPHLLLASMLEPDASYSWAHLALSFADAELRWPALRAGRMAFMLLPDDDWVMETLLVSEVNWSGCLTDELREWLRDVPPEVVDPSWITAISALDLLMRGRASEAVELVPRIELDAWWCQEVRIAALILGRSLDAASDDVRSLVDEAEHRGRLLDAAWWALLVDRDRSASLAEMAAVDGTASFEQQAIQASIELIMSDGRSGRDRLLATIDRTCRPFRLRHNVALRIPLLVAAYPDHDLLRKELESLAVRCKERLHNLDPAPSLNAELKADDSWCEDFELAKLVQQLLQRMDVDERSTSPDGLPQVPWLPGASSVADGWNALTRR